MRSNKILFVATWQHAGLIDKSALEQVIYSAHHEVFGMSISRKDCDKMVSGEDTAFTTARLSSGMVSNPICQIRKGQGAAISPGVSCFNLYF